MMKRFIWIYLVFSAHTTFASLPVENEWSDFPANECKSTPLRSALEDLRTKYDEGMVTTQKWRRKKMVSESGSTSIESWIGERLANRRTQTVALAGTGVVAAGAILYTVSFPASAVVIVALGGALYIMHGSASDFMDRLAYDKGFELDRIRHISLVTKNQEYDRKYLWDEQILRFGNLSKAQGENFGIPSYAGSPILLPITELPRVLNEQFLYFYARGELLTESFRQLTFSHQRNNWYVRFTTKAENARAKADVAQAIIELYGYQWRLALATAFAVTEICRSMDLEQAPVN